MQQLTGIDATFLYMENDKTFGHVSSLIIFDPKGTDGGSYERTKQVYAERLHLMTPMRRRLAEVPFNLDHPYWVEDGTLDLDFHIRETAVPPPGNDEQLGALVSRLIARPLDRSRPLWELYVITGLEGGRIAQLTKVHHAAIDGVGGAQLLGAVLDLSEDAPPVTPEPLPEPEAMPSDQELFQLGLQSLITRPYNQGRLLLRMLRQLPGALDLTGLVKRLPEPLARVMGQEPRRVEDDVAPVSNSGGFLVPSTRFNNTISKHRKFAFTSMPLEDVKAVKSALGVTVNDVVLAMCSGALRTYLDKKGELPEHSLRAMIPVSVRSDDQANSHGNQVSNMLASLATDVEDVRTRVDVIHQDTLRAKESLNALPAGLLTDVVEFAPPAIAARVSRVVARTQIADRLDVPFNIVISNVPGPQFPLWAAGAEMLHYYPVSTVTDMQALNITIQSYNGKCDFGLVACAAAVPDVWDLCGMLEDALEELKAVAGV